MPGASAIQPLAPTISLMRASAAATPGSADAVTSELHPVVFALARPWPGRKRGGSTRSRRGGAAQAVVERETEAVLRNRHDRDGDEVGPVERAQRGEEIGSGLAQIAGAAEPARLLGALWRRLAEGEQRLVRIHFCCVQAQRHG